MKGVKCESQEILKMIEKHYEEKGRFFVLGRLDAHRKRRGDRKTGKKGKTKKKVKRVVFAHVTENGAGGEGPGRLKKEKEKIKFCL